MEYLQQNTLVEQEDTLIKVKPERNSEKQVEPRRELDYSLMRPKTPFISGTSLDYMAPLIP